MATYAERKAMKQVLCTAAGNGVSRWLMSDESGLADAGVEILLTPGENYFVIRVPGPQGPTRYVVRISEQT